MLSDYPFVKCANPRRIVSPYTGETLIVPCGSCNVCRNRQSSRYTLQCRLEGQTAKYVRFITLTTANTLTPYLVAVDSHVSPKHDGYTRWDFYDPDSGELIHSESDEFNKRPVSDVLAQQRFFGNLAVLSRRMAQLFIKRLRNYIHKFWVRYCTVYLLQHCPEIKSKYEEKGFMPLRLPKKIILNYAQQYNLPPFPGIRYFLCGEYGPKHYKPHYHILIFTDSDWLVSSSDATLSFFPKWTWSRNKDYTPCGSDVLSYLEYAVRSAWPFGINETAIPRRDCSNYVASYINNSCSLPFVFERCKQIRPFVLHSSFLGQRFLKKERKTVYQTPFEDFVRRSCTVDGFNREYDLWRSCYSVFFPKCKGYVAKSAQERLDSLRLYTKVCESYPGGEKLINVAVDIITSILLSYKNGDYEFKRFNSPSYRDLLGYFASSLSDRLKRNSNTYTFVSDDEYKILGNIIHSCYSELLLSRHFVTFCVGSHDYFLAKRLSSKIDDFYAFLDKNRLAKWYESMSQYFENDYACDDDIIFFYNNTGFDPSELLMNPIYKRYMSTQYKLSMQRIKHKRLVDSDDPDLNFMLDG